MLAVEYVAGAIMYTCHAETYFWIWEWICRESVFELISIVNVNKTIKNEILGITNLHRLLLTARD